MNRITVTEEKKMTVPQRKEAMPYELVADGVVIAVVMKENQELQTGRTKCPNCKFEYDLPKQDNSPAPFSVRHP